MRLHSITRVKLQVSARKNNKLPRYSSSQDKPVLQCKDVVCSCFNVSVFSVTFRTCLTSNYMKPGQLFRCRYRYFLHTAIREFMRLLLHCCCIRAHPPSAQAGRQIKVGRFFVFHLQFNPLLWRRNLSSARHFLFSLLCPSLSGSVSTNSSCS